MIMKDLRTSYFKVFNAIARVVGYIFMVGGLITTLSAIAVLLQRERNSTAQIVGIIMGCVVSLLGFLLIRAKPYNSTKSEGDGPT
jgi:hypothetical protein